MDALFERLIIGAATIDEILSNDFEVAPGKGDADLAARRFEAWCRSAAGGDRSLFVRRLSRDGLSPDQIMARFAAPRRKVSAPLPAWAKNAGWVIAALAKPGRAEADAPIAFDRLLTPIAGEADAMLWRGIDAKARDNLAEAARAGLRRALLTQLSELAAPALYERFAAARKAAGAKTQIGTALYDRFAADMQADGFRQLFEAKPVLLRLIATLTQQWIDVSREFVLRLNADLPAIRRDLLKSDAKSRVIRIDGDLSDPHNNGRSVRIVHFEDGARVVYKPKDLGTDIAWHALVNRLNAASPPIELKAMRALARSGYGWTEFITHSGCVDEASIARYFGRAGAWLALFHGFVASDMHQENIIAAGDHPVPIDLETILQAAPATPEKPLPEDAAFDAAMEKLTSSVMMVGLLPAYGRSPENKVFAMGGLTADWGGKIKITWDSINSDAMRPARTKETVADNPNLPHVVGHYQNFSEHIGSFVAGFKDYAAFLTRQHGLFDGFSDVVVRRVLRPTRFYSMLLQRLKNYRSWDDGITWSAQADFIARLADWDRDDDPLWAAAKAERAALLALNVPYFVSRASNTEMRDDAGFAMTAKSEAGLARAKARVAELDAKQVVWQTEVIAENTAALRTDLTRTSAPSLTDAPAAPPTKDFFTAEATRIAEEMSGYAVRKGPAAAWIGLDWLGDAEVFQLVCLGPDLYNGDAGIALFFAAHAAVTGSAASAGLARGSLLRLRKNLKSRTAARFARSLGLGGATGLGSIVYALAVTAKSLRDDSLLADSHRAASLFTDELIAADKQLDVIGGSAGGILGLLRLCRDSQSADVLGRAIRCGEHLLAQSRIGPEGCRSWVGQGFGTQALNGMSHGAAGFAYALSALAAASGRDDFAKAASECIALENSRYDEARHNWPDLRTETPSWPCQWCHGAPGIGLARFGSAKRGAMDAKLTTDIANAVEGVQGNWPGAVDTLCCGTLGCAEFLCEAGRALERDSLVDLAARQLAAVLRSAAAAGDFRWNSGKRRFNLGLFRGLAGVGYTALRQADRALPNVLIWE